MVEQSTVNTYYKGSNPFKNVNIKIKILKNNKILL